MIERKKEKGDTNCGYRLVVLLYLYNPNNHKLWLRTVSFIVCLRLNNIVAVYLFTYYKKY